MQEKKKYPGPKVILIQGGEQDERYLSFKERFEKMSDKELVDAFNEEVGNPGWTGARGAYLAALHSEFRERGFDFSEIGNEEELSLAKKVTLIVKKLIQRR